MREPTTPTRSRAWLLSLGAFGLAALFNRPTVERFVAPDEVFQSSAPVMGVYSIQIWLVLVGLWFLRWPPRSVTKRRPPPGAVGRGGGLGGAAGLGAVLVRGPKPEVAKAVRTMIASENLLLDLKLRLKSLSKAALDLDLSGPESQPLFAAEVEIWDLDDSSPPARATALEASAIEKLTFPLAAAPHLRPREDLRLWAHLWRNLRYFRHGGFGVVRGDYVDADHRRWECEATFDGVARTAGGNLCQLSLVAMVTFSREGVAGEREDHAPDWSIVKWRTTKCTMIESPSSLFSDVTSRVLREEKTQRRAISSPHQEQVLASYLEPDFEAPYPYWSRPAYDDHPGIAVTDIDQDGFDDLYIVDRAGKHLLLRNRGDGSFEECAEKYGLDLDGHGNAALFADLDNDGDADLVLARGLRPSLILTREGDRFVDRSVEVSDRTLPALVSSVVAADVNRDGLLDLYFSTYARDKVSAAFEQKRLDLDKPVLAEFLPESEAKALTRRLLDGSTNIILVCPGAHNLPLVNPGGGRFADDGGASGLDVGRNTYQSTFVDLDGDGDQDVYCANDFAPNNLFLNDGKGQFRDVSRESGTEDLGFGMGASFGDYDDDGDPDLYVSNMFSKAGRRMTVQVPGIDPRFTAMAGGNSLFQNNGQTFAKVSGMSEPAQLVEKSGWAWGGQFQDFVAAGDLDLYADSGYEPAPLGVEGPVDR